MPDRGLAEVQLIADRNFLVSCMVGFACQHVAETLKKLEAASC
jgi:hypothetical protein